MKPVYSQAMNVNLAFRNILQTININFSSTECSQKWRQDYTSA